MPLVTVDLRLPLVLVPGKRLDDQLLARSRTWRGLPGSLDDILRDLNQLAEGAPAFIDPGDTRFRASLVVHTHAYRIRLVPTDRGTGYFVRSVDPLRLADHARLAHSSLLVHPPHWAMVLELREIPDGSSAQWRELAEAWGRLSTARTATGEGSGGATVATVTAEQSAFLSQVDRLIDATEEIETREQRDARPFLFHDVSPTGGKRNTPQSVYEFHLVDDALPPAGAFVRVQGADESRGQVNRAAGRSVTVRFDEPVSWPELPSRGALEITPSTVVYAKQRQAVAAFRTGQAENPALLPALAEHRVGPVPASSARPREELDPEQCMAFQKALATTEFLVVLGPPGTGKTRTITEIAHAAATVAPGRPEPERVLITSHANRAVDNVLARLSRDLVVIRVGVEHKVHDDVKPLLLEQQTESLAGEIQGGMTVRRQAYGAAEEALGPWMAELDRAVEVVHALTREERAATERFDVTALRETAPLRERLATLQQRATGQRSALAELTARAERIAARLRSAQEHSEAPLLGWFHRLRARRAEGRLNEVRDETQPVMARLADLEREIEHVNGAIADSLASHPAVVRAREASERAQRTREGGMHTAYAAADRAVAVLSSVVPDPPAVVRLREPDGATAELERLREQLAEWLPLISRRRALAEEWHDAVARAPEQLAPELIRFAHVVGATCIGAASRPELSGVEFDLGIIDEAGQLGVADALVPLSRVRRGILVGDDRQLPPFLDSEVAEWGRGIGDPDLLRLMSGSALERLRSGLPSTHVVQLTKQRRMPAEIGDFISAAFYDGTLRTEKDHHHADPLFASPLAFVDTSELPERERYETRGQRAAERFRRKGVFNRCEARLLARLAAFYHRRGAEWMVIVPYLAQRAAVLSELKPLLGDSQLAEASVGSVDAYQGGEREVVLYGFTRSNPHGRIGFLSELRRVNVAFTRAQRQLVITGDLSTLLRAADPGFRALSQQLYDYLGQRGDLTTHQEVMGRLRVFSAEQEES
ncbi:AAA family ATPase [Streptomyces sp. 3MP-14]|uniref:AAA family ATPase n=1 Tax=Streptomyces mimosae TaxID=2586635 RepID=A0A5N6A489_9ACTN|nr:MULTISPECIES: AAA domain-containing protein [Streptomyces]KAB8162218.1 AAA family ATPase [Streptomyces mimosae]KAB8173883.1 AAA family ATPase [Streptomyces sp. 3MP-14]